MSSWKITITAPQSVIEAALLAHEEAVDWDAEVILSGFEVADDRPEEWLLEVWLPRRPTRDDRVAITALFAGAPPVLVEERLDDADWVAISQAGLTPIQAGCFWVHTPDHAPDHMGTPVAAGIRTICIPASRAFGTGHHATTAGCLAMLSQMRAEGMVFRNIADIGTGTGLLAFAALHLWPRALASASDIDFACVGVVADNATLNTIPLGARQGELTMIVADGMDDSLLRARGPHDLIIANILAGPLITLAPDFARALIPGGSLLLAGLLATQEGAVRTACHRAGLRLARRVVMGDWSILWLRKRAFRASDARHPPAWQR